MDLASPDYDSNVPVIENEKTYSYPLDIQLKFENNRVVVAFGERDGICIGHALMSVNGQPVTSRELPDGRNVFDVLADKANFPLNLKFGRPKITTNQKIILASMFYPLFALAVQLSPEQVIQCFFKRQRFKAQNTDKDLCILHLYNTVNLSNVKLPCS